MRKNSYKRVHKAYTKAYDQDKYKELYEEEDKQEEYPDGEKMDCMEDYGMEAEKKDEPYEDCMMMEKRSDYGMMDYMEPAMEGEKEES